MGRPKLDNPKNKQLRIRLTEYEHMVLKGLAALRGVSMATLLREAADKALKEIAKELTEEQKRYLPIRLSNSQKDILLKEDCENGDDGV